MESETCSPAPVHQYSLGGVSIALIDSIRQLLYFGLTWPWATL